MLTLVQNFFPRDGRFASIPCGALLLIGAMQPTWAQSTFATVQGAVTDASGAAITGASVRIFNDDTGNRETVTTGSAGEYRAFDLNAGIYTITVSRTGFGDLSFAHQVVLARQVLKLDAQLSAGAVAMQVDVNAEALTSDVETVSHSLSSNDINTLALNFRASDNTSPLYVATLTPGAQTDPGGNISVAGGFPYTTSYSIDGISTVNARFNGPSVNLFPSVEAISEFKVNTANNDAEFGQPSDITVTTKAGTNAFHGSIYEFFANRVLNASNGITGINGKLTANDFGAYIGGPLSVPHLYNSKGKTSSSATMKAHAGQNRAPSPSVFPRRRSDAVTSAPPRPSFQPAYAPALHQQSGSGKRVLSDPAEHALST